MLFQITEHSITGCWYGRRNAEEKAVSSDELYTVLRGFSSWIGQAQHISATKIEDVSSTAPFTVYMKDCASHDSKFMFALWLSSNRDDNQKVYALNVEQAPNTDHVVSRRDFNPGEIPGFPAYIFVDTSRCKLYTLKPHDILNTGRKQFDAAVRYYMEMHHGSIERSIAVEQDGTRIVSLNMVGENGETLSPKFESEIERQPTSSDEIINRCSEIRKVIRIRKLRNLPIAEKRSLLAGMLEFFSASVDDSDIVDSNRVKLEFDVRLTRQEVKKILRHQENNIANEEIGFKFKNDQKVLWANNTIIRKNIEIPLDETDAIVSSANLLAGLEAVRDFIV